MIRRFRTLAALIALVALSAFLAESAWALVCTPGMASCEMEMAACEAEASSSTTESAAAHHPAPSPEHSRHAPTGAPVCPMAFASGGCAVAALPSIAMEAQPETAEHQPVLPSFDRTPDLLVVAGPFRPPRA